MDSARRVPVAGRLLGPGRRVDLDGAVVLVTGAARGIGAETARQLHARGASVVLVGRSLPGVQDVADELGERALAHEADVGDLEALQRAADAAVAAFGGIDVVIANAGIAPPSEPVLTIDPGAFERTVDVDLLGQWRTVRAVLPSLTRRRGHVLVVSSVYAFFNGALNAPYAASKAGVEQLVRALRVELATHGATAGVAYLGFVDTAMANDAFENAHVDAFRRLGPAFLTRPIPVADAAAALVRGVEQRSARVAAPGWVLPMLRARGLVTTAMDEFLVRNPGMARLIARVEAGGTDG